MKTAALIAAAALLAGCSGSNYRDLEQVPLTEPQQVEIYANLDGHPNLVRLCIDSKAFITTTRKGGAAWRRADYFDDWCAR